MISQFLSELLFKGDTGVPFIKHLQSSFFLEISVKIEEIQVQFYRLSWDCREYNEVDMGTIFLEFLSLLNNIRESIQ